MGSVFTNFHAGCHGPVPLETTIGSEDVGDLKRSFDVLVDQQDRLALRRQAFDRLVDDGRDAWLDASGGLVDDQDGIVHQAAGDLKLALLSAAQRRSEEHTSELQSPCNLVCRLLLEKKKNKHRCTYSYKHRHQRST